MNKYYCTKCDKESVIGSFEPVLEALCCDGDKAVKHRLVSLRGKDDPKPAPAPKTVEVPVTIPAPAPKPQTKLDVSSGPVKAK